MTDDEIRLIEIEQSKLEQLQSIVEKYSHPPFSNAEMDELEATLNQAADGTRGSAFDGYQSFTQTTAVYPSGPCVDQRLPPVGVLYTALGLNGEAGEIAEKVKKNIRGDDEFDDLDLEAELGDVLWYLTRLADEMGYDLQTVARTNIEKLSDRQSRGVLKGSGDDR